MKIPTLAHVLGFCLLGSSASGQLEDLDPFSDEDVRKAELMGKRLAETSYTWAVTFEVFSLPFDEAVKLRRSLKDPQKIYNALIKNDKERVTLEELLVLQGKVTQNLELKSVEEFIYPTEFEPPELPLKFENIPEKAEHAALFMTPAMPSAFDTVNLGNSLEMTIVKKIAPQTIEVRLKLNRRLNPDHLIWGQGLSSMKVPKIETQSIARLVTLQSKTPTLVGTFSPPGSKEKKKQVWWIFATATSSEK